MRAATFGSLLIGERFEWEGGRWIKLSLDIARPMGIGQRPYLQFPDDCVVESIDRGGDEPRRDLAYTESFSQWLDRNNDSLPEPESFSDWLAQNDDSIN